MYNVVLIIWFDFFVQNLTKWYLILIPLFDWFHNERVDKRDTWCSTKLINNTNITGPNTAVLFQSDLISVLCNYFIDFTIRKNSTWTIRSRTWCKKKFKSIILTLQDIILVFFFTELQSQPYSKILKNISTKTDFVTRLSVHLINLIVGDSSWLIWELMIAVEVPLENLFKCWVGNKHVIYCIAIAFFNKYIPNSSWSIFFFRFAKAILTSESVN